MDALQRALGPGIHTAAVAADPAVVGRHGFFCLFHLTHQECLADTTVYDIPGQDFFIRPFSRPVKVCAVAILFPEGVFRLLPPFRTVILRPAVKFAAVLPRLFQEIPGPSVTARKDSLQAADRIVMIMERNALLYLNGIGSG